MLSRTWFEPVKIYLKKHSISTHYKTAKKYETKSAQLYLPLNTSPKIVSQVITWPSDSCSNLIGTPIDILMKTK